MNTENLVEVSVVCLTYNHEKYVDKMLNSLVNQETNFKYEILVHDDASTDATQQIIMRYEKLYPTLIRPIFQTENQFSKGISPQVAYNYPRIRGKYVAFCEGDDYWSSTKKLQIQHDIMEQQENCSICVHGTQCVFPDGELSSKLFPPVKIRNNVISKRSYMEYELRNSIWLFQTSSYFVRAEVIKDYCENYTNYYPVGDLPLVFYALQYGECYYIPQMMSCYRTNSGGFVSGLNSCSKRVQYHHKMIEGHRYFDKKTQYMDHDLFDYAIRNNEVSILLLEGKYREILSIKYNDIWLHMSVKRKWIIVLGIFFPKLANKLERFKHGWTE